MKRSRIVILFLVLTGSAYGVTSYARGASDGFPAPPGFTDLPAISPSPSEAVSINDLLGPMGAAQRYGVTASTVTEARRLASTPAGNLYLVGGTAGACLALTSGAACGDPRSDRMLALAAEVAGAGLVVGGGVVSDDVSSVTITASNGVTRTLPVLNNVFRITEKDGLPVTTAPLIFRAN